MRKNTRKRETFNKEHGDWAGWMMIQRLTEKLKQKGGKKEGKKKKKRNLICSEKNGKHSK